MTLRDLPAAKVGSRPGLRSELAPSALDRWNSQIKAAASDDTAENTISILDPIGADWFGEGVTSKRIAAALRAIGPKDVVVNINSPGGDYFEGLAIYNLLREHPGKVTAKVVGIAASAASVIAMAADELMIARAGFLMIHNTWVIAMGDRNAFRDVADWLEPFDLTAVDIYSARSGLDEKEIARMLDRETWIGGADAVEKGFADSLLSSDEIEAAPANHTELRPANAIRKLEHYLAKAGVSRKERTDLVMAVKGSQRDAAATGLRDAAVYAEVSSLLSEIRSIKTNA